MNGKASVMYVIDVQVFRSINNEAAYSPRFSSYPQEGNSGVQTTHPSCGFFDAEKQV
jgi:hypothetical protein